MVSHSALPKLAQVKEHEGIQSSHLLLQVLSVTVRLELHPYMGARALKDSRAQICEKDSN